MNVSGKTSAWPIIVGTIPLAALEDYLSRESHSGIEPFVRERPRRHFIQYPSRLLDRVLDGYVPGAIVALVNITAQVERRLDGRRGQTDGWCEADIGPQGLLAAGGAGHTEDR